MSEAPAGMGAGSRYGLLLGVGGLVVLVDQLAKLWVMATIPLYGTVPVIPGFFDLVHIRNRGAAFGFLNRHDIEWQFWLFLVATLVAVGVILALVRAAERRGRLLVAGLGLVLGGAVGNLLDRVRFRAVVDFLDFYAGLWHWPAFNVADIAICCGAFLVGLSLWLARDPDREPGRPEAGRGAGAGSRAGRKKGGSRA